MPISTRRLIQFTIGFLLIGFLSLMTIVGMNFWLGQRAQAYFEDAIAARDTRVAAVELRSAMQTAEASQRGFIFTGNEIYLAPYQTSKTQAQNNLTALRLSLPFYLGGPVIVERLSAILTTKFSEFDQTIALKREGRDAEVLAIFRTNTGKTLTDKANVFLGGIIAKADNRLTAGVAEQRTNAGSLRLVSGIGALVIVLVIGGAGYGITRYTRELRMTRDQISVLNGELEGRVAARTADLSRSRDRAEVLLSEVNHRVANSLALVSSLVKLQSRALVDPAAHDALAETAERILAISLVHKRLYASDNARSVSLDQYLEGLLDHLRDTLHNQRHGITLTYALEPIELYTDASINLGVVTTELVTNAFKYAYPGGTGEIRIVLQALPDGYAELIVEDDGVGRSDGLPAKGTGLGTKIVNAMCISMGAEIDFPTRQQGTAARLVFPSKPTA